MISYDYLEKMFFRLHEAQRIGAAIAKDASQKEKNAHRNYECAIKGSIRDYLATHGGASNARD